MEGIMHSKRKAGVKERRKRKDFTIAEMKDLLRKAEVRLGISESWWTRQKRSKK
jgi:hypothetical protein